MMLKPKHIYYVAPSSDGTTPKVVPNTKKNYKYKTLTKGLQSQKGCSCYMPM